MTFAYSFFFNYYLYLIINDLSLYAFTIFQAQPLLFFIIASLLFIPPEIIYQYFEISCHYIHITLDYLWSTLFQLDTNVGYLVRLEDRDIIFDFSPHPEEESIGDEIINLLQQQDQDMYCLESFSDEEMENLEITSTDYDCVDDDINYDIDDMTYEFSEIGE